MSILHTCAICNKTFKQKGHLKSHEFRKNPCKKPEQNQESPVINEVISTSTLKLKPKPYIIHNTCCIKGLTLLKEQKKTIQLTVTSPPYFNVKDYVNYDSYTIYLKTLEDVFTLIYSITDDGRMCCVNISNILIQRESRSCESKRIPLAFHFVILMEKIGWKFIEDILWIKPEGAAKNRNGGFFQHRQPVAYKPNIINEYIFIFQKPSKYLIDKIVRSYDSLTSTNSKVVANYERTNVWKINPETKVKHPAPYPEELADKLITYYSFLGDTVLDPFMGSGTTAVVSYKQKRNCIGFEIHQEYITLFEERIKTIVPIEVSTKIVLSIDDYKDMTKEGIIKKLSKHPKKYLFELIQNDTKLKKLSKEDLVEHIYTLRFMNTT